MFQAGKAAPMMSVSLKRLGLAEPRIVRNFICDHYDVFLRMTFLLHIMRFAG
jgi:hypothetical protein